MEEVGERIVNSAQHMYGIDQPQISESRIIFFAYMFIIWVQYLVNKLMTHTNFLSSSLTPSLLFRSLLPTLPPSLAQSFW